MPKLPTRYPRWGYAADPGDLIEPPAGAREIGYQTEQRPPAQWFNFWKNLLGGWVDFLRGPSLANWTWHETGGALAVGEDAFIASDTESDDDAVRSRVAIAGIDSGGNLHVYVSYRGHEWDEVSRFVDTTLGDLLGFKRLGSRWFLWTATNLLSTVLDDGTNSALTVGGSELWQDDGESDVADLAINNDGDEYLLIKGTVAWEKSTDGETWTAASVTGTPTGFGASVVWSGTKFVSITSTGQVWVTPDLATNLTLAATLSSGSGWKLVAGEGRVFACRANINLPPAYVSTDHGTTWTSVTLPASMNFVRSVLYSDGQWLAGTTQFPYFWTSNDGVTWNASYVPIPQDPSSFGIRGIAVALRSVLLMGTEGAWVLQSTVSHDAANGDPTTFTTPVPLSDAAYFRGVPLDAAAPTNGQAYVYDNTSGEFVLATVSGLVIGDPKAFDKTFTFSGGAYDYTADANFASVAFPDAEADHETSAILGDGVTVPYFYAVHTPDIGGLDRTVGGKLRLTLDATGTSPWPGNQDAPAVMIPLPRSARIEVEFTLALADTALQNGNRVSFGIARDDGAGNTEQLCRVDIEATGATTATEVVTIWGNAYGSASVNAYVAAARFERHYRVVIDGPNLAVYGGAVGATTAATLIHGRSYAARGLSRSDITLFASVASSIAAAGLYTEIDNLHYEGVES